VRVAGTRQDTILAFLSSGCTTCRTFWEELREATPPRGTRMVIVTRGAEAESPVAIADVAGIPRRTRVRQTHRGKVTHDPAGGEPTVEMDGG
jgi:hypothetical protein